MDIKSNADDVMLQMRERIEKIKNSGKLTKKISIHMTEQAVKRFKTTTDPDGKKWAENTKVTIARKKSSVPGSDTGRLKNSIKPNSRPGMATSGTNVIYAPTMQYGAKKGQYKSGKRPVPWGNIPKRKFLGFSKYQKTLYRKWIKEYISK